MLRDGVEPLLHVDVVDRQSAVPDACACSRVRVDRISVPTVGRTSAWAAFCASNLASSFFLILHRRALSAVVPEGRGRGAARVSLSVQPELVIAVLLLRTLSDDRR